MIDRPKERLGNRIEVIEYPFGAGAGKAGAEAGPILMRAALQRKLRTEHGISWRTSPVPNDLDEEKTGGVNELHAVTTAATNLAREVTTSRFRGKVPVIIGGDHTQGLGTANGILLVHVIDALESGKLAITDKGNIKGARVLEAITAAKNGNGKKGVDIEALGIIIDELVVNEAVDTNQLKEILGQVHIISLDAHGDFNTPEMSASGNAHGMWVAAVAGLASASIGLSKIVTRQLDINPENIHIIGARDLDGEERALMKRSGVKAYGMDVLRAAGEREASTPQKKSVAEIVKEILGSIPADHKIHVTLDIDGINADKVPATGTPVGTGSKRDTTVGPSLRDVLAGFSGIANDPRVVAIDLSEINPGTGERGINPDPKGRTLHTAQKLLLEVLGLPHEIGRSGGTWDVKR